MRVISKDRALYISKPEGINVDYYLFNEYEIHYNEQAPNSTQVWHHHEKIWETLFIIEGELIAKWRVDGVEKEQVVRAGDLVETEHNPHTFVNNTDQTVKFLVIKQVLTGQNKTELLKTELLKTDKVLDQ